MQSIKQQSTIYTEEKIASARINVTKHAWAEKLKEEAVEKAEKYLANGEDFLWNLVTPQTIPRCTVASNTEGCPNCGSEMEKKHGIYGWTADPQRKPWKVTCPNCSSVFPSNDFEAYYESGKDRHGVFRPELADRGFLKNVLYPNQPVDWGVDDGYGWIDENGYRWVFIAYYNNWGIWEYHKNERLAKASAGFISHALEAFRDAFLYEGSLKYARAGLILLDRIADFYPGMDISVYPHSKGYYHRCGGVDLGKITGCISEPILIRIFMDSYDAFFPAVDKCNVVQFLKKKAEKYSLGDMKSYASGIKKNIEDNIILQVFPALVNGEIRGNTGMYQGALALAAVVMDDPEYSDKWLEWNFRQGERVVAGGNKNTAVTGGNIKVLLIDDVGRDGLGNEVSPSYNRIWLKEIIGLCKTLRNAEPKWHLHTHPKVKKMFHAFYKFIISGKYMPSIGDNEKTGNPSVGESNVTAIEDYLFGFELYRTPVLAQTVYFLNGNTVNGIHGDIFSENPEKVKRDIEDVVKEHGTLNLQSRILPDFGLAVLKDGLHRKERDLWLYFGRNNTAHAHHDVLNLGLYSFGIDMSPDLGNPEIKIYYYKKRFEWTNNTVSHNTVVVDKAKQSPSEGGSPLLFDRTEKVKLIEAEAPDVYPQVGIYRRTTAFVNIDDENSYGVDFFRVAGGNEHHFSFHGAEGNITPRGLDMIKQPAGTYAGKDIEFGNPVNSRDLKAFLYEGSGFHYLYDVAKDKNPPESFSFDWEIADTWNALDNRADCHLELTLLGNFDDVAAASGDPPQNKPGNPRRLKYVIAHRKGEGIKSNFVSVIQPYKDKSNIKSIERVSLHKLNSDNGDADLRGTSRFDVEAVRIGLENGRVDYVISSLDPEGHYIIDDTFHFRGTFGVYQEFNGKPCYAYLCDGKIIGDKRNTAGRISGKIAAFTRELSEKNSIVITSDTPGIVPEDLPGRFVYIKTNNGRTEAYEIAAAVKEGERITLDVGDATLIKRWKDKKDFSKGYECYISEGDMFYIPLSFESFF